MALGRCHMVSAVRAGLSRLPFVVLLVLAIMALSFVFMMLCRYEQNRRNAGGAGSPQSSAVAYGEELPATGRFTKEHHLYLHRRARPRDGVARCLG